MPPEAPQAEGLRLAQREARRVRSPGTELPLREHPGLRRIRSGVERDGVLGRPGYWGIYEAPFSCHVMHEGLNADFA